MTHTTEKPQVTMSTRPMLDRTDVSRMTNSLAFAGAAMLHAFALRQGRAAIGCVDAMPGSCRRGQSIN